MPGPWDKLAQKLRTSRARKAVERGENPTVQQQKDILAGVSDAQADDMLKDATSAVKVVGLPDWARTAGSKPKMRGGDSVEDDTPSIGGAQQAGGESMQDLLEVMREILSEVQQLPDRIREALDID